MEILNNDYALFLEMLPLPAFIVQEDKVTHCNNYARQLVIMPGDDIAPMLRNAMDQFKTLRDGSMSVNLMIELFVRQATITKLSDGYLFTVQEQFPAELKAMSLLSNQLRIPLSRLFAHARAHKDIIEDDIHRELYRISRMFNNIANARNYAEADAGYMQERNLCSVVEEILEECAALLSEIGIPLKHSIPAQPIYTVCDAQMIHQAVYNLIDNAVQYSAPGEPIEFTLSRNESTAQLTVKNRGNDLSGTVRANMFSCYTREPNAEDGVFGLGIGMAVINNVALAHGGTVLVSHRDDGRTQVTMTLQLGYSPKTTLNSPPITTFAPRDDGTVMLSNVLPAKLYKPE